MPVSASSLVEPILAAQALCVNLTVNRQTLYTSDLLTGRAR